VVELMGPSSTRVALEHLSGLELALIRSLSNEALTSAGSWLLARRRDVTARGCGLVASTLRRERHLRLVAPRGEREEW